MIWYDDIIGGNFEKPKSGDDISGDSTYCSFIPIDDLTSSSTSSSLVSSLSCTPLMFRPLSSPSSITKMTTLRESADCIQLINDRSHEWLAIGGHQRYQPLSTVECFDSKTQQWCHDSTLVAPLEGAAVAIDPTNGRVYRFGGLDLKGYPVTICDWYDPATRVWTLLSSTLNAPRDQPAAIYAPHLNGFIIIGGVDGCNKDNAQHRASAEFYSPANDTFIYLPQFCAPDLVCRHSLQFIDNRILVMIPIVKYDTKNGGIGYMMDISVYDTIERLISSLSSSQLQVQSLSLGVPIIWTPLPPLTNNNIELMRSMILAT
jgi:hypothetical protein